MSELNKEAGSDPVRRPNQRRGPGRPPKKETERAVAKEKAEDVNKAEDLNAGEAEIEFQPMLKNFLTDKKEVLRFSIPIVVAAVVLIICMTTK